MRFYFLISLLFSSIICLSQNKCKSDKLLAISKTENCLNQKFLNSKVDKKKFNSSFENYFIKNALVEDSENKGELYMNILKYIETHPDKMPFIENQHYIIEVAKKIKLTIPKLIIYDQLECIRTQYTNYKPLCKTDTNSTFSIFGDISKTLPENNTIHYSLIASTLRMFTNTEDLNKEVFQDNIVLIFWFQLAGRYGKSE